MNAMPIRPSVPVSGVETALKTITLPPLRCASNHEYYKGIRRVSADDDLIRRAQAGCGEAFAVLMKKHLPQIRRHVSHLSSTSAVRNDLDDIMQEVQFKIWRSLAQFRFEASFSTWMTRIAVNEIFQHGRKRKRVTFVAYENLELPARGESPAALLLMGEQRRAVKSALDRLPKIYRDVLLMGSFERLPLKEIAFRLGASVPAVKSRLFRAKARLAAALASFEAARVPAGSRAVSRG